MIKQLLTVSITLIVSIGLFSFLSKEEKADKNESAIILGMVLLAEPNSLEINNVVSELKNRWKLKIGDSEITDEISVLEINGYQVAIANMPVPIPSNEVESAAEYNYLWKNGVKETSKHKGHVILSIMNAGKNPVQENLLFSKIASAVMNNSKSIGLYIGGRTLVLKKEFYDANIQMMSEEDLPLYIWIYFGQRKEKGNQSVYTYGLADFGKKEMEIVNSNRSFEELNEMIFNLAHYVLAFDVTLNSGETIGISEDQKLRITESEGRYLEGTTLKIEY